MDMWILRYHARVALALAALLGAATPPTATAGGPIILAGHDPDDHGFEEQYVELFDAIMANVTNGGSGILAVGADPGTDAGNWIETVAAQMAVPQTVTFVNDVDIASQSLAGFAMIHVPSTGVDTAGGIHPTLENPLLVARAVDIAAFINGGGGLFGLTQDSVDNAYEYLGLFADIQSVGVPPDGECSAGELYDSITATSAGQALGITDTNVDGCCWHNVFTSFAPFLQVLAIAEEPGCSPIDAKPAALGCLQCDVPGQNRLTPALAHNLPGTDHTVTATLLEALPPNDPIEGVTVSFEVLEGPNAGDTGSDPTDANGEATFTYTGDGGLGVDVIQATCVDPVTSDLVTSNTAIKFWDLDCNSNGIPDTCDIDCSGYGNHCGRYLTCGTSSDTDSDDVPDECGQCTVDLDCDNGLFCDGPERCIIGTCHAGIPPDCSDGNACTTDSCDTQSDACSNDGACDDLDACTENDTCQPDESCVGTPMDCDDAVACTDDQCVLGSCISTANHSLCIDGVFCNGTEFCDPVVGCEPGTPPNCNDGVSCTVDICDGGTDQCVNTADDSICDSGAYCDGVETCDPVAGCQLGAPVDCSDGVDCTVDVCEEGTQSCKNVPDHAACDDGSYCSGIEACDPFGGCLGGTPVDCNDGVSCTVDACDDDLERCVNLPLDLACDDGIFCDGLERCDPQAGCEAGMPIDCSGSLGCPLHCDEAADACVVDQNDSTCLCGDGDRGDPAGFGRFCIGGDEEQVGTFCAENADCDVPGQPGTGECALPDRTCVAGDEATLGRACNSDSDCDVDGLPFSGQCAIEDCDPPEAGEVCDNRVDDDGDGLFDCADPDCPQYDVDVGQTTCGGLCQEVLGCKCIENDPAVVFITDDGLDLWRVHGRLRAEVTSDGGIESPIVNPARDGFGVMLSNARGRIFEAQLAPGEIEDRSHGRFKFKDRAAKRGEDADGPHKGLFRLTLRFRKLPTIDPVTGEKGERVDYLTFKIRAFGDFSIADPQTETQEEIDLLRRMTTQVYAVPDIGYITTDWNRARKGWRLRASDVADPSICPEPR